MKLMLAIICILTLAGCGQIEKVYTYKQSTPAADGHTYNVVVHLKMNAKHDLTVLEEFTDGDKRLSKIADWFKECTYFDDNNWQCVGVPGNDEFYMKQGNLTHLYWAQNTIELEQRWYIKPLDLML